VLCTALGALGYAIDGFRLASVFAFAGLLLALGVYWYADRFAIGMLGGRLLPQGEAPGLHSTLERLVMAAGVAKPKLYVLPHGLPVALSAGRGVSGSAIGVSRGLLELHVPAEVEAIVAHEVAHLRNRDVLVQTVAVVIASMLVELSRVGGWFARGLLYVLGPVAASFVHLLLSPKREFEADCLAAELCGTPHGLADALVRLEQATELVEFRASPATEPLWTVNPFAEVGPARLFGTHPPVGERVARLRALDPDWPGRLRAA